MTSRETATGNKQNLYTREALLTTDYFLTKAIVQQRRAKVFFRFPNNSSTTKRFPVQNNGIGSIC